MHSDCFFPFSCPASCVSIPAAQFHRFSLVLPPMYSATAKGRKVTYTTWMQWALLLDDFMIVRGAALVSPVWLLDDISGWLSVVI